MVIVTTPTDAELAKIANNDPYMIVALRRLFTQAGTLTPEDISTLTIAIEGVGFQASSAGNQASQANDTLDRLMTALELAALAPRIENIKEDNLTPVNEPRQQDTLADLAPTGGIQ